MLRRLTILCDVLLRMPFLEGGSVSLIKEIWRSILDCGKKKLLTSSDIKVDFAHLWHFGSPAIKSCVLWVVVLWKREKQTGTQSGSERRTADPTLTTETGVSCIMLLLSFPHLSWFICSFFWLFSVHFYCIISTFQRGTFQAHYYYLSQNQKANCFAYFFNKMLTRRATRSPWNRSEFLCVCSAQVFR